MKGVRWTESQYQAFLKKKRPTKSVSKVKRVAHALRGKNKTEAEFERWFKCQHPSMTLLFEAVRLRIDATCWYLPDFWCPEMLTFFEVKGPHIYEDSVIKFKAARAIHAWAHFEMWQRWLGSWRQIRKLPGEGLE